MGGACILKKTVRRIAGAAALFLILFSHSGYCRSIDALPQTIILPKDTAVEFALPRFVAFQNRTDDALPVSVDEGEALTARLAAETTGSAQTSFSLFGITLKPVRVSVVEDRCVGQGGQIVGIALLTDGALVVGTSRVLADDGTWRDPAGEAGLAAGDLLTHIDGEKIEDASFVSRRLANLNGERVTLRLVRGEKTLEIAVQPVREAGSGTFRLGVWVRDSTAGVGTLTYADAERGTYGALGHGVVDNDTKQYLTVPDGRIAAARVTQITRGQSGAPGQIMGSYTLDEAALGNICRNNEFGIYGALWSDPTQNTIPIGYRSQVETGPAQILSAADGELRAYDCVIEKITPQRSAQAKSLVVRVTDARLLELTGGIMQGMSGSPIVQNGRLVAAVTHVFVNDPQRGYGVFIEWMLEQSDALGLKNEE